MEKNQTTHEQILQLKAKRNRVQGMKRSGGNNPMEMLNAATEQGTLEALDEA